MATCRGMTCPNGTYLTLQKKTPSFPEGCLAAAQENRIGEEKEGVAGGRWSCCDALEG